MSPYNRPFHRFLQATSNLFLNVWLYMVISYKFHLKPRSKVLPPSRWLRFTVNPQFESKLFRIKATNDGWVLTISGFYDQLMPILPVFLLELKSPTVVRIVLVCSTHSIWKVLCRQCTDRNQMDPISFLVNKHVGVSKNRGGFPPKSSIKK